MNGDEPTAENRADPAWRARHGFDSVAKLPCWETPHLRAVALEDLPAGPRGWAMRVLVKMVRRSRA